MSSDSGIKELVSLACHALRIYISANSDGECNDDVLLLQWIESKGLTSVRCRDVLRLGPNRLRQQYRAQRAINKLVLGGYLAATDDGAYDVML